jgi:hypothetical protein
MKVLEKKEWEKTWSWQCTCPQCESKLEAESKDVHNAPASGGNQHDYCEESFFVVCPVCSQHIAVPVSVIPKYVAKLSRDRAKSNTYFDR